MIIHWKHWEGGGKGGTIAVTPEDSDDIWTLYNIIVPGDEVETVTLRRVVQESSSGGTNDSHKVKMWLLVRVEKTEADLKAASLRVNGRNIRENEHVKMGSYHTLDIQPDRKAKITKQEWSSLELELLQQAASAIGKSEVAAVVIQEGTAVFCIVNANGNVRILDRVEQSMPKKRLGSKQESAIDKFYSAVIGKLKGVYEIAKLKALVFAGPGDPKDELYKRFVDTAIKTEDKEMHANKNKIIRVALANAQPGSLQEILKEPRIAALLADTKCAQEARLLDSFHKELDSESGLAVFGQSPVMRAVDQGAIKNLLLSDSLFRSPEIAVRKQYAGLVDATKQNGGTLHVYSTGSETDSRLMQLTGVAAILRFPLFDDCI